MARIRQHIAEIVRLNRVGISMQSIAARYGCHQTSIVEALKDIGQTPIDTRRSFMEDIYVSLTEPEKEHLQRMLDLHGGNIKSYIKTLISRDFTQRRKK